MKRGIIVGLLLCALSAQQASATVVTGPEGQVSQPYQQWADRSAVPLPPLTVTVIYGDLATAMPGYSFAIDSTIHIGSGQAKRFTFYHEFFHVVDHEVLTDADRREFRRIMRDTRPWRPADGRRDDSSPHETFAEAGAWCARYRRVPRNWPLFGDRGFDPSPRQYRRACSLIRRIGQR